MRVRKYIKPWWNVSSHCDITSKSVKIQWYEVHCNVTSDFFCKMTWFLHECHILMCMEGNVRFTEIATLHEGLYKCISFLEGYINLFLFLRVILHNEEVYAWEKRNVIEYCHNYREGNVKEKISFQHIKEILL